MLTNPRSEAAVERERARVDRVVAAAQETDPSCTNSVGRSLTAEEIAAQYPKTRPLPAGYSRPKPMGWATAPVEPIAPSQRAAPGAYHKLSAAGKRAYAANRRQQAKP